MTRAGVKIGVPRTKRFKFMHEGSFRILLIMQPLGAERVGGSVYIILEPSEIYLGDSPVKALCTLKDLLYLGYAALQKTRCVCQIVFFLDRFDLDAQDDSLDLIRTIHFDSIQSKWIVRASHKDIPCASKTFSLLQLCWSAWWCEFDHFCCKYLLHIVPINAPILLRFEQFLLVTL